MRAEAGYKKIIFMIGSDAYHLHQCGPTSVEKCVPYGLEIEDPSRQRRDAWFLPLPRGLGWGG